MKSKPFADEQITYALRQAECRILVADVCRQLGVQRGELLFVEVEVREAGHERDPGVATAAG